jgi:hypothetical protein
MFILHKVKEGMICIKKTSSLKVARLQFLKRLVHHLVFTNHDEIATICECC